MLGSLIFLDASDISLIFQQWGKLEPTCDWRRWWRRYQVQDLFPILRNPPGQDELPACRTAMLPFNFTALSFGSSWRVNWGFDKDHVIMSVSAWNFWMYLISDVRSSLKPKSSRIHLQVFMFSMFCLVWILEAVFVVQEEKLPGQFALWSSLGFLDPRKAWNQRNIMTLRGEEAWNTASNCIPWYPCASHVHWITMTNWPTILSPYLIVSYQIRWYMLDCSDC